MDKSDERNGVRLDWVVNLGHILQAAVVVCGLIAWAIASAGRAEQAQRDLSGLKTDVGVQLRELRETLGKDLAEIHQELRVVSDQRVRMDATEKVLAQHDTTPRRTTGSARSSVHRAALRAQRRHSSQPRPTSWKVTRCCIARSSP